ncbi:MAG: Ig-like domain-containing protein [Oscillospiraceae bacterium]|nr:Ig-like domain-containing protein [Oscillospiraceae bacterium]
MAEIKCGRCDRRYSSFRGRCPYCGTPRRKSGKRVAEPENARWKFIIGILLVVILIAAVIILIVTGSKKEPEVNPPEGEQTEFAAGENTESVEAEPLPTEPEPVYEPEPEPEPVISTESVTITWNGNARDDVSMSRGEVLNFGVRTVPEDSQDPVVWSTENEDVIIVLQTGQVTAIGRGTTNLVATCGDAVGKCIIRVT